jgi:elongator complex protein 1
VEWEAALLPASEHPSGSSCIAGLEYVLELDAVMVALASGDLLLIYTETKELEEVGSIQGGIACMAWSPDGELLALVSNSGNLLLMTKVRVHSIS